MGGGDAEGNTKRPKSKLLRYRDFLKENRTNNVKVSEKLEWKASALAHTLC